MKPLINRLLELPRLQLAESQETGEDMISDTLSEAAVQMRHELESMPDSYPPGAPITVRIVALIEQMDAVRQELENRAAAELAADDWHNLDEMGGRQPPG